MYIFSWHVGVVKDYSMVNDQQCADFDISILMGCSLQTLLFWHVLDVLIMEIIAEGHE